MQQPRNLAGARRGQFRAHGVYKIPQSNDMFLRVLLLNSDDDVFFIQGSALT